MAVNLTASVSPGQSQKTLTKIEIFEDLVSKSCKVIWKTTSTSIETSGCFIQRYQRDVEVFTCFHEASWKLAKITILYQSHSWKASLAKDVNSDLAACYDLAILSLELEGEVFSFPFFQLGGFTEFPVRGEDIFFSGYPLGQNLPLTHMGYVSGVEEDSGNFKIDGTVLRGHSGGPVVRTNEKGLELIGAINSQLVEISETFLEISQTKFPKFQIVSKGYVPPPKYAGKYQTNVVVQQLISNFLSNMSTGIGNAMFVNLRHIVTLTHEDSNISEVQQKVDDHISDCESEVLDDECDALETFQGLLQPDPWMQRNLGIRSDPLPSTASNDGKVSELPVMKGEDIPARARKKSPEWNWAHQIKTNKRALFNDITGRESNKGKEGSRGKDNITDPEYALLLEYFHLEQGIKNQSIKKEDIDKSSQTSAARDRLLKELTKKSSEPVESLSFEKIQKAVKRFENKLLDTRPKSKKWKPDELEAKKGELIREILTLPEGKDREALIQKVNGIKLTQA